MFLFQAKKVKIPSILQKRINYRLNGGVSEAKAARIARKSNVVSGGASSTASNSKSKIITPFRAAVVGGITLTSLGIYDIRTNKEGSANCGICILLSSNHYSYLLFIFSQYFLDIFYIISQSIATLLSMIS